MASQKAYTQPKTVGKSDAWDNRTRFAVYGQAFLLVMMWVMSLGRLINDRFWNAGLNEEKITAVMESESSPAMVMAIKTFFLSYFKGRFIFFFPHILGAFIWLNLYFLQLIPSFRKKHLRFHRIVGRVLMVSALAQTISGAGLAYKGKSSTIKIISYALAVSVMYCVYNAWYFAAKKDIEKHRFWAMRLVGYTQAVSLQRLVSGLLFLSKQTGWPNLYPDSDDDENILVKIFEDSFSLAWAMALMLTEWYLAGYYGWTEMSQDRKRATKAIQPERNKLD